MQHQNFLQQNRRAEINMDAGHLRLAAQLLNPPQPRRLHHDNVNVNDHQVKRIQAAIG